MLYILKSGSLFTMLTVYVDDILLAKKTYVINKTTLELRRKVKITNMVKC